jgi:hypothetical protein
MDANRAMLLFIEEAYAKSWDSRELPSYFKKVSTEEK